MTLQAMDGRLPDGGLARVIRQHFQNDETRLVKWVNAANSTQFAELAPLVIRLSKEDDTARQLMQKAANEIKDRKSVV